MSVEEFPVDITIETRRRPKLELDFVVERVDRGLVTLRNGDRRYFLNKGDTLTINLGNAIEAYVAATS